MMKKDRIETIFLSAIILVALLGGGAGAQTVIREQTELVNLTVTVTDSKGRAVTDIKPEEFEVFEDKVRQRIEYYRVDDAPLSIGIIYDISGSMRRRTEQAREALRAFIETSHPGDDFTLIGFNRQASVLTEFSTGNDLLNRIGSIGSRGETALYDAIYLGIEKLLQSRHRKRAILVISDGKDNSSRYTLDQIRSRLKEADIQLYCVGLRDSSSADKLAWREELRGQRVLEELAGLTGGRAFAVSTAEALEEATTRAATELRQQYSLGYASTNELRDGRWREIRVRVRRSGEKVQINVKSGYYAPLGPPVY